MAFNSRSRSSVGPWVSAIRSSSRRVNSRPITDANWSVFFGASSRRSIRAMITPWIVSGTNISSSRLTSSYRSPARWIAPTSCRDLTTSSTKNGFPSAFRTISAFRSSGSPSAASMACAICALSSAESAVRASRV